MKKLLLLLSIFVMRQIQGQTWVTIPDANFVIRLQNIVPAAMNGNQLNTSSPLVTTTTHLINVSSGSIANLSGIQYFTSLDSLYCVYNNLTSLPTLSNSLTYLNCQQNFITNLPTLPNSLVYLDCSWNPLTNLPSLPNSIQDIECNNDSLINLPTLPNALISLNCNGNHLSNLPALPNSLTYLYCNYNHLTSLPSLPNSLLDLTCYNNYLTTLPSLPNSLNQLWCYNNNITCFPVFPNSITDSIWFNIDPNPYNCLPNHITAMSAVDLAKSLCATGNSNGCAVAGIEQLKFNNIEIVIYPNPASDQFYIETNATDKLNVDLYDINGRHVFSTSVNDKSNIDVTTLDNGIYSLTIKSVDRVTNKKLVIVR